MTRDELRSVDQRAIDKFGMSGLVLMENAGRNVASIIVSQFSDSNRSVCIVCGKGNNAGDGFVVARHLEVSGFTPHVFLLEDPDTLSYDAKVNYDVVLKSGLNVSLVNREGSFAKLSDSLSDSDVVVDALVGTGLKGAPRGWIARGIRCINQSRVDNVDQRTVSIDIPSGMDCDKGTLREDADGPNCVRADLTITLVSTKVGFNESDANAYCGKVVVAPIGAPAKLLSEFKST